jgi:16S rRNA (cytosine967-C5)-methyltransferase
LLLQEEGYDATGLEKIFPWKEKLSEGISYDAFNRSFLIQPALFIRLRPGKEEAVMQKLKAANLEFACFDKNSIGLANAVNIEEIIDLDREAVIQDISSQKTGELLLPLRNDKVMPLKVWDCCAASGGKSIMATDVLGEIDLTVSDIRESILYNLEKRFIRAGIQKYKRFVCDLTKPGNKLPVPGMDLVIADAPCTGSGTWGRTPEQLFYFNEEEIEKYAALQRSIAGNAVSHLKAGGYLLYITCSVFKSENEDIVKYLAGNFPMSIKEMKVIKGYDKKADTMFAALLQKGL